MPATGECLDLHCLHREKITHTDAYHVMDASCHIVTALDRSGNRPGSKRTESLLLSCFRCTHLQFKERNGRRKLFVEEKHAGAGQEEQTTETMTRAEDWERWEKLMNDERCLSSRGDARI